MKFFATKIVAAESKGQPKIDEVVEFGAVQWKEDQKEGHHTESLREARQKLCESMRLLSLKFFDGMGDSSLVLGKDTQRS